MENLDISQAYTLATKKIGEIYNNINNLVLLKGYRSQPSGEWILYISVQSTKGGNIAIRIKINSSGEITDIGILDVEYAIKKVEGF